MVPEESTFRAAFHDADSFIESIHTIKALYNFPTTKDEGAERDTVLIEFDGGNISVHDCGGCEDIEMPVGTSKDEMRAKAFKSVKDVVTECSWPDADLSRFGNA